MRSFPFPLLSLFISLPSPPSPPLCSSIASAQGWKCLSAWQKAGWQHRLVILQLEKKFLAIGEVVAFFFFTHILPPPPADLVALKLKPFRSDNGSSYFPWKKKYKVRNLCSSSAFMYDSIVGSLILCLVSSPIQDFLLLLFLLKYLFAYSLSCSMPSVFLTAT